LGDFGVAHLVDLGQTQTGGLIGTLAYMSPEQITGAPISIAADLYALGVTLFEVVAGRLPFLGPDFVAQHLGEEPPLASTVADGIPHGWDPILAALLVKNPRERMQTLADLRQQLEHLDLQGQPRVGPRPKRESGRHNIAQLAEEGEVGPRYQFETPLGQSAVSHLARAVDTVLDRSVIIERFDQSDDAAKAVERARMLGRAQSPFVQRALSLDRAARIAVFEAPSGASLADSPPDIPPTEVLRILKRLARGAAAIHINGGSHGAIAPRTIVLDDVAPTIMVAGLGTVADSQPVDDVNAIIGVCATLAGCEPTFAAFAKAMCDEVGAPVPTVTTPIDAESLYAAADAVDIAVLSALGSR
jgi:serine/threonine-protein kinase